MQRQGAEFGEDLPGALIMQLSSTLIISSAKGRTSCFIPKTYL